MEQVKRKRGRPRSQEVINRDEIVFQAVAGSDRAVTKYEISGGTGIDPHKVYTSLRRLSLANRVFKVYIVDKQHYWSNRDFNKPQPEALFDVPDVQPVTQDPVQPGIPSVTFSSSE